MINQVSSGNIATNRSFSDFSQPQNGWYLPVDTKSEEIKKEKKYGKTIVLSGLAAGFGLFAIMKGAFPKTISKQLEKWRIKLENKTAKDTKFHRFYRYALNKTNSFIQKFGSINNLTSLKDVLFQKLMFGKNGTRKFTRNIHERITRIFNKISQKTVNSTYGKTQNKFAGLNEYISTITEKLLRENPNNAELKAAIETIETRMKKVNSALDNGFGINARNNRLKEMNEASESLFDYFWNASFSDIKNFKSKNMWQTFIADDYIQPAKTKLAKDTGNLRRIISRDIKDNYNISIEAVDNLQKYVDPKQNELNEILSNLRLNLNKYKNISGKTEITERAVINEKIISDVDNFIAAFKNLHPDESNAKSVSAFADNIKNAILQDKKGELQEILSVCKKYLSQNEYISLKNHINSTVKSLDKSINIETVQYFDKVRDLKLGSAPTDVLSILGTMGAVGWFLGKADNKEERISASLKYGIPAIGAIATSLYTTARLVSGGKSLALGLLSGWVINKIGAKIDDTRKKYSVDVSFKNKTILKPQSDKV